VAAWQAQLAKAAYHIKVCFCVRHCCASKWQAWRKMARKKTNYHWQKLNARQARKKNVTWRSRGIAVAAAANVGSNGVAAARRGMRHNKRWHRGAWHGAYQAAMARGRGMLLSTIKTWRDGIAWWRR